MKCVCGYPHDANTIHRTDGPCYDSIGFAEKPEFPDILSATEEFMRVGGQLESVGFDIQGGDVRQLRRDLLAEEVSEYILGEARDDLAEVVDGLLDVIVIAWGTLLAYVGPDKAKAAAAEVVRSNLSKIDGSLGPIVYREDGKIMKPEGWTPPNIAGAIA